VYAVFGATDKEPLNTPPAPEPPQAICAQRETPPPPPATIKYSAVYGASNTLDQDTPL
jgi:hypothetical protein